MSELAAEMTKIKAAALTMWGKTFIPATLMATTNGEALALVDALLAASSSVESAGTMRPDGNHEL